MLPQLSLPLRKSRLLWYRDRLSWEAIYIHLIFCTVRTKIINSSLTCIFHIDSHLLGIFNACLCQINIQVFVLIQKLVIESNYIHKAIETFTNELVPTVDVSIVWVFIKEILPSSFLCSFWFGLNYTQIIIDIRRP